MTSVSRPIYFFCCFPKNVTNHYTLLFFLSEIESNPFDGIESGWWSKGEVKRNQVGLLEQMRLLLLLYFCFFSFSSYFKKLKLIYF